MQYGTNQPFGLAPLNTLQGNPWTGLYNLYIVANASNATTTALFEGDPVVMTNAGTIAQAAATTPGTLANIVPVLGVFQGCIYQDTAGVYQFSRYLPNATAILTGTVPQASIIDDPYCTFAAMANNAASLGNTTAVRQAFIGLNAALINPAGANGGNTALQQSTFTVDVTTTAPATDSNLTARILRLVPLPGVLGSDQTSTSPYVIFEVLLQNHFYNAKTAGI